MNYDYLPRSVKTLDGNLQLLDGRFYRNRRLSASRQEQCGSSSRPCWCHAGKPARKTNVDKLMEHVGDFGPFQKKMAALGSPPIGPHCVHSSSWAALRTTGPEQLLQECGWIEVKVREVTVAGSFSHCQAFAVNRSQSRNKGEEFEPALTLKALPSRSVMSLRGSPSNHLSTLDLCSSASCSLQPEVKVWARGEFYILARLFYPRLMCGSGTNLLQDVQEDFEAANKSWPIYTVADEREGIM
ncbi:hypothetical protein CCH79_00007949 [Gambusia affinis]|uniref:Uncharacterized protein n=1 Tax=Gambusia affinis TaxID=33528 RepID=A0A315WCA7_GAMAF|nr:hypothetical protein CCH79_00007949 [Gambusia affinis]